jgi:hypothetical protein
MIRHGASSGVPDFAIPAGYKESEAVCLVHELTALFEADPLM